MRNTAFLILVTAVLCCCKKERTDCCTVKDNLMNEWEIRKSEGGIAGTIIHQPGNGFILAFKGDTFTNYANGTIIRSGTYELQPTSDKDQYRITFHTNGQDQSQNIILKADTLVLLKMVTCCDFPDETYVKISQ